MCFARARAVFRALDAAWDGWSQGSSMQCHAAVLSAVTMPVSSASQSLHSAAPSAYFPQSCTEFYELWYA